MRFLSLWTRWSKDCTSAYFGYPLGVFLYQEFEIILLAEKNWEILNSILVGL